MPPEIVFRAGLFRYIRQKLGRTPALLVSGLCFGLLHGSWAGSIPLAALIASALTPLAMWYFGLPNVAALFLLLTILVWFTHRANIARLLTGSEGRIGAQAPDSN